MQNKAIFAGGCFWGMESLFKKQEGVLSTRVGYIGGEIINPTYQQVSHEETGHREAVEVIYDPEKTSYSKLAKFFFEIHDFTQTNGQGPDLGEQYMSVIFYLDDDQKQIAEGLIEQLEGIGYEVATQLQEAGDFWPAEEYHQDYYAKTGGSPYCHIWKKIF